MDVEIKLMYQEGGESKEISVIHPRVAAERRSAVRHFLERGCTFVPDVEVVPDWLSNLPHQVQQQIASSHAELLPVYKLTVPAHSTVAGPELKLLMHISELQHLSIAVPLHPEDMSSLAVLQHLDVLVIRGKDFGDLHCEAMPMMHSVRMLDIQDTAITNAGLRQLETSFPTATMYADPTNGEV